MTALGFSPEAGRLYERVLPRSGEPIDGVAAGLGLSVEELLERLEPLRSAGVVTVVDDLIKVATPADAVAMMIQQTADSAAMGYRRLQELAAAMPHLAGSVTPGLAPRKAGVVPLDGEVLTEARDPEAIRDILTNSVGDVMWLRPDQFQIDFEDDMSNWIRGAVGGGRRVRGIYALRAMQEVPSVVTRRIELGEEIRVLPELPTRLIIIGTQLAAMPEPLGMAAAPSSVIRQRGIVEALRLLFEEMWNRAAPVSVPQLAPDVGRAFLLEQLAAGAQDEQIARRLGVSLRTVRRRVAELMQDLGAGSRFQAGVEAVRRGWL